MARIDVNRSGEMEVFARVVELGGFSAAARAFGMTPRPSASWSRGWRRGSARGWSTARPASLQLTPEGCAFYERSIRDPGRYRRGGAQRRRRANSPAGRIRVNTSASYGTHVLAPIVPEFLERVIPTSTLDIVQTDHVVDLLAERTDVAVRAGPLKSSTLIARKLGDTALLIAGSPAYLAQRGTPVAPDDLQKHDMLGFDYARAGRGWPFRIDGATVTLPVEGRVKASDGEALRFLAVNGCGLARLAEFAVSRDIAEGRLVPVLDAFNTGEREAFHAVYVGQGGQLPARVRALLDFLAERGRVG